VLADDGLICGQINAKRLIVRNVAFEPLDIGAKLAQHAIRLLCRSAELFAFEGAHPWNIPFDDKLAQCHIFFSLIRTLTGKRLYPAAAFPRSPRRRGDVNPFLYASKLISPSSVTLAEGRRWAQPCSPGTIESLGTRKTKVLHQVNQLVAQSKIRKHP